LASAFVWLDVAGIGQLILGPDIGWIAAFMMVFLNGIIFAAVQFALKIMPLAEVGGTGGGHGAGEPGMIIVPVPAEAPRRRSQR